MIAGETLERTLKESRSRHLLAGPGLRSCQCIREAVADVEFRRMSPLPETSERLPGCAGLFKVDRNDLNCDPLHQSVETPQTIADHRCQQRTSMTMDDSTQVADDIQRASAASIASANLRRSGSFWRITSAAEVLMTISPGFRLRHSRGFHLRDGHP